MTVAFLQLLLAGCGDGKSAEDADGDGVMAGEDCNDGDAAISPGVAEVCNGVDDDCDGRADEEGGASWYVDADGDTYGDEATASTACAAAEGSVSVGGDCDDGDDAVRPGVFDDCRGIDQDCDGGEECNVGEADYRIVGDDDLGWSVALGGDVDGDGRADVLVGRPDLYTYGDYEVWGAGDAYLFLGSRLLGSEEMGPSDAHADIVPETDELSPHGVGYDVAFVRDADGDGLDEVLVSAIGGEPAGNATLDPGGAAYLVSGSSLSGGGERSLDEAIWRFGDGDIFGYDVASAGDVDGDGAGDALLVGYEHAYLVRNGDLQVTEGVLDGAHLSVPIHYPAAGASGDVDGDGLDEVIIGEPGYYSGGDYAGAVWLFAGDSVRDGSLELETSDADWAVYGPEDDSGNAGRTADASGDIDGDGLDDLITGAPAYQLENDGAVFAVLGSTLVARGTMSLEDADLVILGESYGEAVGSAISNAGDFDGDDKGDILIGGQNYTDTLWLQGRACVFVSGGLSFPASFSMSQATWRLLGDETALRLGTSVGGDGDVDGDGLGDIVAGGQFAEEPTGYAGAWLLLGDG